MMTSGGLSTFVGSPKLTKLKFKNPYRGHKPKKVPVRTNKPPTKRTLGRKR